MKNLFAGVKDVKSLVGAVLVAVGGALSEGTEGGLSMVGKVLVLIGTSLMAGTVAVAASKAPAVKK